jgi:hypothetical protein
MGSYGDFNGINGTYPLVNIQKAIENGDYSGFYPLKMVMFHSFLYVYQRVMEFINKYGASKIMGIHWNVIGDS